MLTYYRRRTDKAHKIILHFFQRLDSNMDSEMMGVIKNRKRITVRYNFCLVEITCLLQQNGQLKNVL